jgi:DNA-binding NarL/FixJ family response regulator
MPLSVVLVDDSRPFMESARALLEQEGLLVVGTASTPDEALVRVRELHPDVVLLDVHLGPASGLEVARSNGATTPVVIMVSTASREDVEPLLGGTPAAGFVPKTELTAAVVEAVVASVREDTGSG